MNIQQKNIIVYSLYGLSVVLLFIFWKIGTQYDYRGSLLVIKFSEVDPPGYLLPNGDSGLRLRMGGLGVFFGAILPIVLAAASAFISKSDKL